MGKHFAVPAFLVSVLCGCEKYAGEPVTMEFSIAGTYTELQVEAAELDIALSGASDATLEGMVSSLELDLSGSSNIARKVVGNSYSIACDRCKGSLSGSSNAYIHCETSIKASISGGSNLHYTGNAATGGSSTSGGSNIIHDVL